MTYQIKSFEDYKTVYQKSVESPESFWAEQAKSFLWRKEWDTVLDYDFEDYRVEWFKGGKLNITENCPRSPFRYKGRSSGNSMGAKRS